MGAVRRHPRAADDARQAVSDQRGAQLRRQPAGRPPATDLLRELGISCEFLGVGVERLDYTKGLPERIRAIGRFLERSPEYQERLVFVQLAAPSRSSIARYQEIDAEVDAAVRDVNTRFATRKWRPVLYLKRHHDHREIWPFYRHADFCMVTSLHDGMNLVAKEFVSVREDGAARSS